MDHQTLFVPQIAYHLPQVSTQPMTEFPQLESCLAVPIFNQGDDPIACLNKAMAFLSAVASSRGKDKVMLVKDTWLGNALSLKGQGTLHGLRTRQCWPEHRNLTEDLDAYDSDCDDVSTAQAVLISNLSNYGSDVISE
ncbi:hypothetical protein Tco_1341558, partial [Tanacetum coccineum]